MPNKCYCSHATGITLFLFQIGRVIIKHMPEMKWMEPCIPVHIQHEFSEVMAEKSEVYPLKVNCY